MCPLLFQKPIFPRSRAIPWIGIQVPEANLLILKNFITSQKTLNKNLWTTYGTQTLRVDNSDPYMVGFSEFLHF